MCLYTYSCVQEMFRCVWRHLVAIMKGRSETLCYTSSLLHTLGSVTVSKTGLSDPSFSLSMFTEILDPDPESDQVCK